MKVPTSRSRLQSNWEMGGALQELQRRGCELYGRLHRHPARTLPAEGWRKPDCIAGFGIAANGAESNIAVDYQRS